MPRQYRLIRAAKVLNCKPWELEDIDNEWIEWAFISENADGLVQKAMSENPKLYNND